MFFFDSFRHLKHSGLWAVFIPVDLGFFEFFEEPVAVDISGVLHVFDVAGGDPRNST
ncbi:hypothetical protein [Haloplanus aerogenes]|uniref:hypothetical protein n=1 Tax=Haloplanus aerogenes TaxID=660522 RepID=UPI0013143155|nr:hypothetical protein [Haloplanus aerogenes]